MQTSKKPKVKPGPSLAGFTKHEPDTRNTTPPPPPPVSHPKHKQFTFKLPKLRPPSFRKNVGTEAPVHNSPAPAVPEPEKCQDAKEQQPEPVQEPERHELPQPQVKKTRHLSDSRQRILELECRMEKLESDLDYTAEVMHKTLVRASLLQVATNTMLRGIDRAEPSTQL